MATRKPTLEQRVDALEQAVWYSTEVLAYQLAQTRHACDCIFHFLSKGMADRIPWEDMAPQQSAGGPPAAPPQQHIVVPTRSERRQAARDFVKRNGRQQ